MTPQQIIDDICHSFEGVVPKQSWGETSLFYNPGRLLPNGVYFCTLKAKNGGNDKASNLNREGVFRLSLGLPTQIFVDRFGPKPPRPPKGGVIETGDDFQEQNVLMPHPIYGWMAWVQILSPTVESFAQLRPLISEAYSLAKGKFDKKQRSNIGRG